MTAEDIKRRLALPVRRRRHERLLRRRAAGSQIGVQSEVRSGARAHTRVDRIVRPSNGASAISVSRSAPRELCRNCTVPNQLGRLHGDLADRAGHDLNVPGHVAPYVRSNTVLSLPERPCNLITRSSRMHRCVHTVHSVEPAALLEG
jgi:hypothetical protein